MIEIYDRLHSRRFNFGEWPLSHQFALAGGLIMLVAMLLAGFLISRIIVNNTVESTASSTAVFLGSFLSPLVQDLATADVMGYSAAAVDSVLKSEVFEQRFPHVEIWKPDGSVAYSTSSELIGRSFVPPDGLAAALRGEVASRYTDLQAREHVVRGFNDRYLEIYVPLREHLSEKIIAVAEVHEIATPLERQLWALRIQSWMAVAGATLLVMTGLFGVVHRAGKLIESQRVALRRRVDEVNRISEQNNTLRERVQRASLRVSEMNEAYLRQVGAELHDGPAQLIGLAALKIEHVRQARSVATREHELHQIEAVLSEALHEIRTISKGLMLPEIERLALREVITHVTRIHEQRTATTVTVRCEGIDREFSHPVKTCVHRFVQEGLNNAFRHAGGQGQAVECCCENSLLTVRVQDQGAQPDTPAAMEAGLGLTGLRERVESLGGRLRIVRQDGSTSIEMSVHLTGEVADG